jgi:signal transduction histidine kinase
LLASRATVLFSSASTTHYLDDRTIGARPGRLAIATMLETTTITAGWMSKLMANFRPGRGETPDPEMDKMSPEARKLLRLAGFLTWFLAGLQLFVWLFETPMRLREPRYQLWLTCFFMFGVTFGLTPWHEASGRSRRVQLALLAGQAVTALVMLVLVCSGHEGALLVLIAAQLGWFMSLRRALLWVVIQAVLMGVILTLGWPLASVLSLMATYVAFQVLALFSCFLAASEAGVRSELARANNELRATGELLANTSRMAERERISRELHDALGHHLTALSLNLEAASHMARDNALVQIQRAQSVTKLLLSDVRDVVGALRSEDPIGLAQALKALVAGVPAPQIHLLMADNLAIDDPMRAHTVLRCVQEIITNVIRHAAARNLWIELTRKDGGIAIRARDDGRGAKEVRPGHGLTGMRERLEQVGGTLQIETQTAKGFCLEAWMPVSGGLA